MSEAAKNNNAQVKDNPKTTNIANSNTIIERNTVASPMQAKEGAKAVVIPAKEQQAEVKSQVKQEPVKEVKSAIQKVEIKSYSTAPVIFTVIISPGVTGVFVSINTNPSTSGASLYVLPTTIPSSFIASTMQASFLPISLLFISFDTCCCKSISCFFLCFLIFDGI